KFLRQKSGFLRQFCSTAIFSCYNKINQKERGGYLWIGSDNETYICLRKAVEVDYGTSISLSSSKSTPNNVSAIGTTGTYSFLGTTRSVSIGPNAG
ncbi:MAG: hypothetical protein PUK13_07025, partial [Clostridiales bacterium]|nr:hypothetical protein [Clostridiales bacterium]